MKIDEKSTVSIGLVIVFVGAIAWLTSVANKADNAENYLKIVAEAVTDIQKRLSRIEGALGVKD